MSDPYVRNNPETLKRLVALIQKLLSHEAKNALLLLCDKYHEADIADAVEELSIDERVQFFRYIDADTEFVADVLEEMDLNEQLSLIQRFKTEKATDLVSHMDPDDAADLLDALLEANQPAASAIIHALPSELSTELQSLLSYEEDTAGALMTSQFVSIPEELSIEEALAEYKTQGDISEDAAHSIFIVTKDGRLVGYTDLRALVLGEPKTPVKDIRNEYPVHIDANTNEEDVARMMKKYDILVAPVVDSQKRLLGVITVDDVVDVMVEAATEDFYKLSGTTDIQESTLLFGRIYSAVFTRLPWLFMTVVGGMVAAFIMSTYSEDFHLSSISLGLTLSFVPLLMGLGGNIGNQSATIIVRGISTGETQRRSAGYFIGREIWVASMIGAVLALCVGLVLLLLGNNPLLSLIIASSIVLNSMIAAGLGSMLPIFFQKINIDPAVASAPFISSTLDIISQIVYFVLTISLFTLWPAP